MFAARSPTDIGAVTLDEQSDGVVYGNVRSEQPCGYIITA